MNDFMIAFMAFLILVFLARTINERANKKLSIEQKANLLDLFSSTRTWTFGILIMVIGAYFLALKYELLEPWLLISIYVAILLVFLAYNARTSFKKLKNHDYPNDYIKSYLIITTIRFVAILVLFGILLK